jgi:C-terminal processing protease CtpA/Prc
MAVQLSFSQVSANLMRYADVSDTRIAFVYGGDIWILPKDGGGITVPGARLYDNDGHWFWEGEGVAPDVEVWDDPNILIQGRDPQVERVVKEVIKLLETQ